MRELKEKTPLLQKTYQITLRIYDYAGKFPRAQKPVLGNKILETANYILEKVMDTSTTLHKLVVNISRPDPTFRGRYCHN